jgi:hypothetical protein
MLLVIGLLVLALQSGPVPAFAAGETVSPQDLIPLGQGQKVGIWKGNDITVDYKLATGQHDIDISGTARFNDNIAMNFDFLNDFNLRAVFTDREGRIIGSQNLATNRGSLAPTGNAESTPFRAKLTPPPGTADIAFGYQGTAVTNDEGGGGGPTRFWQYIG